MAVESQGCAHQAKKVAAVERVPGRGMAREILLDHGREVRRLRQLIQRAPVAAAGLAGESAASGIHGRSVRFI